jgi:hypothetical protein
MSAFVKPSSARYVLYSGIGAADATHTASSETTADRNARRSRRLRRADGDDLFFTALSFPRTRMRQRVHIE